MSITHRTFFRHLLMVVLMTGVLFLLGTKDAVAAWFYRNAIYLSLWSALCAILGYGAHRLAGLPLMGGILRIVARLFGPSPRLLYRRYRKRRLVPWLDLLLRWAACPRCVSWWSGMLISLPMHIAYWPNVAASPEDAANGTGVLISILMPISRVMPVLFLALLGASIAAMTAVGFGLIRRIRSGMYQA